MSVAPDIEEAAASFLARQDRGGWSQADQAELDAWLDLATAHRVAWLRLKAAWDRADRMGALNVPASPPPRVRRSRNLVLPTRIAAALAGVLVLAAVGSLALGLKSGGAAYQTEVGVRENVPLPDGSRVELNTDTRLRARVSRDRRTVWLDRGEAYFEVAHDRLHPFVVFAGSRKITVLGTRFSVRRDGDQVEVVVAEGRVRVDPIRSNPAARSAVVTRGDVLIGAPASTLVAQKTSQDVANALSWRQGAIVFDQTTLTDAAAEFNRYNAKRLVITDAPAGAKRIGGSFEATNVSGFARVLQRVFGLKVEEKGDEIVVSS